MAKYLSSLILNGAVSRLVEAKTKSGFVDFLVLKRALKRAGKNDVSFSSVDPNFTGAMVDLAGTVPIPESRNGGSKIPPFVKVFGTAETGKYIGKKFTTNGPAVTLAGSKWLPAIQVSGSNPRHGSLIDGYVSKLPALVLKNKGELPGLLDSAVWYYRSKDIEERFGAIADTSALSQYLRDGFINELGFTEEELNVLFDETPNAFEGHSMPDILQSAVATPEDYLPDLDPGTGNLHELVGAFTSVAGRKDAGLHVSEPLFLRFAAALGSKRFVILSGLAGSGKTKLAQAFARWLAPASEDEESAAHLVIPVGADWTGSDAILGYPDGLDPKRYVTRPALDLIQRAAEAEGDGTPHFLILDEMNLSHVERYFADLLSLIESGEFTELYRRGEPDGDWDGLRSGVAPKFRLPSNLFIIGTVNVDETTYMFSPKVLDRANVIEFRVEREDLVKFLGKPRRVDLEAFNAEGFKQGFGQSFTVEADKELTVPEGVATLFEAEMLLLFDLLGEHNAEFGFRVANEAARFMHFYQVLSGKDAKSGDWFEAAMDAVIVQKLLPKLHGSRTKLEGLLWAMAYACGADRTGIAPKDFLESCKKAGMADNDATHSPEAIEKLLSEKQASARYKLSFDKLLRMYRKLIRDQFVTFAEA
jgi:hypothetical protein